jgi:hypothetical protein
MEHVERKQIRLTAVLIMLAGFVLSAYAQANQNYKRSAADWPTMENHKKMGRPITGTQLCCSVNVPTITADNANIKYTPMPFPVTLRIVNCGTANTDTVWSTIIVPPDLALADPGSDKNTKTATPAILAPNDTGVIVWSVKHPITLVQKTYSIRIWTWSTNTDSSICEVTIVIPPLNWGAVLQPRDYCPDSLHFDNAADSYQPNPFMLRLTCVNTGSAPAFNVSGELFLPPDVIFDTVNHPGQKLFQFFSPSTMYPYKPGDPIPELRWWVYYTKRYRAEVTRDFGYKVGGLGITGIPLDTADVWGGTRIPGLLPHLSCDLKIPDSLGLNAQGNGNTPNPFQIKYTIRNDSKQTAYVSSIRLADLTADGIRFDATDSMKRWGPSWPMPGLVLAKDESRLFTWTMFALPRLAARLVPINIIALDDEGDEVKSVTGYPCSATLPIAPIPTAMMCRLEASATVLKYVPQTMEYDPKSFTLTATLTNSGGANLDNLYANLVIKDTLGLVEFDPAWSDNSNPKTWPLLFPATNQTFDWGLRIKTKNVSGVLQRVSFSIGYGSDQTPKYNPWTGCEKSVDIEPANAVSVPPLSPESYSLSQNNPNPFSSLTTIAYMLPRETDVTLTITDALGRVVTEPVHTRESAGTHRVVFDGSGLAPGVYLCRLAAASEVKVRFMTIVR